MKIETEFQISQRGTKILEGDKITRRVFEHIKSRYRLEGYVVQLHLVPPDTPFPRSENSHVSLREKTQAACLIGIQPEVHIHAGDISSDELVTSINKGNKNPNVAGIIIQLPIPKHLVETLKHLNFIKDIDSLNPNNNVWTNCATSEAVIRLLRAYGENSTRIGVVGANGFVGKDITTGIRDNGIGDVVPIEFRDSLSLLKSCQTVISAVGQPGIIRSEYLSDQVTLGIDVGNTRLNGKTRGDFDLDNVDGYFDYLTPVPGGMGPLEMAIIAERTVRNTVDRQFCIEFKR